MSRSPLALLAAAAVVLGACSSDDAPASAPLPEPNDASQPASPAEPNDASEPASPAGPNNSPAEAQMPAAEPAPDTYLLFNQRLIEGLAREPIDLSDSDAVFVAVFAGLPEEVTVYPSENYYYFILHVDGRQIWGNIRLPAGRREHGVLSFGYYEFIEFPTASVERISGSKFYTDADGVLVSEVDPLTYTVRFQGKIVTFRFHELDQSSPSPAALPLAADEIFVQRTFDESGYQFYLVFNDRANYFLWVLNEEEPVPDVFDTIDDDLLFGRRSGFAFYVDRAHGDRKILAGVRQLNIRRNDYFDGPFDQLADNYADETGVAEYMQRAFPALRGRIDKYGYYTDRERPLRVALSTYFAYAAQSDMLRFLEQARGEEDPYAYISRGGRAAAPDTGD